MALKVEAVAKLTNEYAKRKRGVLQVASPESHCWKPKSFPKEVPQSAKTDSLHKSYPCLRSGFLCKSGSTSRVGLTAQTPEVRLTPPVRLVSAPYHLRHIGLDGGRNDIANFRLFGATRNSATPEFCSEYPLGLPPSASLVADPSRRYELAQQRTNHCYHELPPITLLFISAKSEWQGIYNYTTMGHS